MQYGSREIKRKDMDSTNFPNMRKFDGQCYRQWKFQVSLALRAKGIEKHLKETPKLEDSKWRQDDAKAMFIQTTTMELSQISLIQNCNTAKDISDKLDAIYEKKSESTKLILHENFHNIKFEEGDTMAAHISKIENIAQQLRDTDENISDISIITKILGSLPEKYRGLRQAWLSLDENKQTLNNLTARIIDEEANFNKYNDTALSTEKRRNKPLFKCYNCNKRGHYAKDCRSPKKSRDKRSSDVSAFTVENAEACVSTEEEEWILDSGASAHMTYRIDFLKDFKPTASHCVRLGDKSELSVKGTGTVNIKKLVNGNWHNSTINTVLYVPDLKRNLFSEGVITSKGFIVVKNNEVALIKNSDGQLAAVGCKQANNLYRLLFKTEKSEEVNLVTMKQWHERLGHVNVNILREMITKNQITRIEDTKDFFCEACVLGKQHRNPFKNSESGSARSGDKIYSDLCGPMPTSSVSGAKYFITFIDAYSKYVTVYFLKYKSEALEAFRKYVQIVENKFDIKVKTLHTDNGKEYCNENFNEYANNKGITLEYSAPYTPQQNGRSERANRTIMESARAMLYAKNMPMDLWAEAVNTAVYLINRRVKNEVSPYETWTGKKPCLSHIRTFGSPAYMHVPKEKRNKLNVKSKKLILVGYDGYSDNYRLYDKQTRKIFISRDVIVQEEMSYDDGEMKDRNYTSFPLMCDEDFIENVGNSHDYEKFEKFCEENMEEGSGSPLNCQTEPQIDSCNMEKLRHEATTNQQSKSNKETQNNTYFLRSTDKEKNIHEANLTEIIEPETYEEAINCNEKDRWKEAINEELHSHEVMKTWELVASKPEKKPIGSKWVFRVKLNSDNTVRFKARLCAKGYSQQQGTDYEETFSPTIRFDTIRTMLSLAARKQMEIMQFDIKTAFLYGSIHEEVYMNPPPGLETEGRVCKLLKSLYGLKQAPRNWNHKFDNFIKQHGFTSSNADKCLYIANMDNFMIYLLLYVDDGLVICKCKHLIDKILCNLQENFEINVTVPKLFIGLELEICKDMKTIFIHQKRYVSNLVKKFNMNNSNKLCSVPFDHNVRLSEPKNENKICNVPYREAVGSLMFAAIGSRPDIYFAVCTVSRFLNNFDNTHWGAVKHIIKYLNATKEYGIMYSCDSNITGYCDADYANCTDTRRSITGYVFTMNGGAITWNSHRQKCVVLSTTEAEYIAACSATKELVWIKQLLKDIGQDVEKITLLIDNQGAIKLIRNPEFHKRSKHIDIQYHYVREKLQENILDLKYISSKEQAADMFTKPLPRERFNMLKSKINVTTSH